MKARHVRSFLVVVALLVSPALRAEPPAVKTVRAPADGVQPQLGVDGKGIVHLIYLTGAPDASDIHYVRATATAGGLTLGDPVRVNAHPGSALAIGTIRGPHLSVTRDGAVHVAWMGSAKSQPKASGKRAPMLYTRRAVGADRFEPERNVVTKFPGLDGGGSVAADEAGNVYVAWHAPATSKGDESTRRVYVARSTDGGTTFAAEQPVTEEGAGVCACCGIKLLALPAGPVVGLFRTATKQVHRDANMFEFDPARPGPVGRLLDPAESAKCIMSTFALADVPGRQGAVAAWETLGRIRFACIPDPNILDQRPRDVPGAARGCKYPALALDPNGNLLIAWAEDTAWAKGGAVAWQMFDRTLRPIDGASGRADGLPAWSLPAAGFIPGVGFVVLY
jgi:hypothetical protein